MNRLRAKSRHFEHFIVDLVWQNVSCYFSDSMLSCNQETPDWNHTVTLQSLGNLCQHGIASCCTLCPGKCPPPKHIATRIPPIGEATWSAAPLNLKITADILYVINGDEELCVRCGNKWYLASSEPWNSQRKLVSGWGLLKWEISLQTDEHLA